MPGRRRGRAGWGMPWAEAPPRLGKCAERDGQSWKYERGDLTGAEGEGAHGKMVISEVLPVVWTLRGVFLCLNN